MLLRSRLLQRYPNAVIYLTPAMRARTPPDRMALVPNPDPDPAQEKPPIFSGSMQPDVSFFGFPITTATAIGTDGGLGYYVVFQEHPTEPRFGLDVGTPLGNASHLTVDTSMIAAGFDLRLMTSLKDVSGIPTEGTNLIIVAAVNSVLHFRIFDGDGKVVVDTDEMRLAEQARQIEDLRKQLESLWPPRELTRSDKGRVITAVTSIVGYAHAAVMAGITRQLPVRIAIHAKRLIKPAVAVHQSLGGLTLSSNEIDRNALDRHALEVVADAASAAADVTLASLLARRDQLTAALTALDNQIRDFLKTTFRTD